MFFNLINEFVLYNYNTTRKVNLENMGDAVPMLKTNSKVKRVLQIAYGEKGIKVSNKLESLKKYETEIEKWTEGNIELLKALTVVKRVLYTEGKLPIEYIFNEGKLQTNITAGLRALSGFKFAYIVDGKMVHTATAPSRGLGRNCLRMYDSKSQKWLPKNEKGDLYTLKDYYNHPEYRKWIEGWKECTEWKERFDVNKMKQV